MNRPNTKVSWNPLKLRRQLRQARSDIRNLRANIHDIRRQVMTMRFDMASLEGFTEGTVDCFDRIDRVNELFEDDGR